MLGPLIKLIARKDIPDVIKHNKIYEAKERNSFLYFTDESKKVREIRVDIAPEYFDLCNCGTWCDMHSEWCCYGN